jgi:hypothetical protein
MDLLAKNCNLKGYNELRSIIKQNDGKDMYLSPDEAIKFGIADFIGTPIIDEMFGYQLRINSQKEIEVYNPNKDKKKTPKKDTSKKESKKKRTKKQCKTL